SILLSDFAETATCPDTSDPLCVQSVRLHQPASPSFQTSRRLIVYFTADKLVPDGTTHKPRVAVNLALKGSNKAISRPAAENIQALPGPTPDSVCIFAEYDLKNLHAGSYSVRATTTDLVRKTTGSQETSFLIQ